MRAPEEVVQKQLEYYNNRDIDGFCSTYSEDIRVYKLEDNSLILEGQKELREKYLIRFKSVGLNAEIHNRIVFGSFVTDHEKVSGIEEGKVKEVIAIYHVKDGLIDKVWFAR